MHPPTSPDSPSSNSSSASSPPPPPLRPTQPRPSKRSSLTRKLHRASSSSSSSSSVSVRFTPTPSPSSSSPVYGSNDESLPLFYTVHTAKKRGRQWLKRTKALSLSHLNLGDGATSDTPSSPTLPPPHMVIDLPMSRGTDVGEEKGDGSRKADVELHIGTDTDASSGDLSRPLSASSTPRSRPSHPRLSSLLGTPSTSAPASPSSSSSSSLSHPFTTLFLRLSRHPIILSLTDPTGAYRRYWLLLIFMFLLYNAICVPFRLAFLDTWQHAHIIIVLSCLDYLSDLFFLLDVGLYFATPYLNEGILERGPKEIKAHYLRTWFWPDLVSSFPFDVLLLFVLPLRSTLPWRLTRLLRFAKYDQYFSVWEQYSTRYPQFIRFSKLILGMMLILHWLACCWFACGYWMGFGASLWLPSAGIEDDSLGAQYIFAFWWATNIVTQVGGDPGLPSNSTERVFDLLIAFLSVFVVAVVIGNVNELVSELNANEGRLREKLQTLNHFMLTRRLPDDLQQRIRSYYLTIWTRRGGGGRRRHHGGAAQHAAHGDQPGDEPRHPGQGAHLCVVVVRLHPLAGGPFEAADVWAEGADRAGGGHRQRDVLRQPRTGQRHRGRQGGGQHRQRRLLR